MSTWFRKKVEDWLRADTWEKTAMPGDSQPAYIQPYLETLTGPDEQHEAPHSGNCMNPKCHHSFTPQEAHDAEFNRGWIKCPVCGFEQNIVPDMDPNTKVWTAEGLNPGGITRSGLTLDQMGALGEQIVLRLGELPGIGTIEPASDQKKFPIDAIITTQKGKLGVEIKTNHSQARQRFKVGGAKERQEKIIYCATHGMKPALVGVRLNFYTNQAYVFFREGLTDTWIGNQKMTHVGTYDFEDINPFRSPDPQAQALAVDNAQIPDQSEDEEFDNLFGKATKVSYDADQPRDEEGKFTFKHDVHEIKVRDKKGKHTHTIKRCKHCGGIYGKHAQHQGRTECPTCGQDPERKLSVAKIVLAKDFADEIAKQLGFKFLGRSGMGHRKYGWQDPSGINHMVTAGGGQNKKKDELDAQFARQRMTRCKEGKCNHVFAGGQIDEEAGPGAPLFKAGQTVSTSGNFGVILETSGEASLVQDFTTQERGWIPNKNLEAVA